MIKSVIDSGWVVIGSWPIDTERSVRLRAYDSAALASSIHLVCKSREKNYLNTKIGDWRSVLQELPNRIHQWMPRLQQDGIVGADAIFACLGPALEIFSRYSRVEKASGEVVTLREYLEQVWAAVAKEALSMIFREADSSGFEEDARLTAMWLWTLSTENNGGKGKEKDGEGAKMNGYFLEYDAARKIGQGLGAHLEKMGHLVEIKGNKARLLPVAERTRFLFGKGSAGQRKVKREKNRQSSLFEQAAEVEFRPEPELEGVASVGKTTLDKVHQCMLLFNAGRSEVLKGFLVEEGIGKDARFWQLAQALSALYPVHSDEKRWVDGVLARKKGLGF